MPIAQSGAPSPPADPRMADIVTAGKIRLSLFLPQYDKNPVTGELRGVGTGFLALAIIRLLATRLGVAVVVIELASPAKAVACLKDSACDVAFLGIEPSRIAEVDFSPPIFQFDYTFLVPAGSALQSIADADRPGSRIAIVRSHASALALASIVKHAELVGAELPDEGFALLRAGNADALALPRDHLLDYSLKLPGSRVLEDSYGINRVGMAVRKGQTGRLAYLSEFAEAAKASGLIQRIIDDGDLRVFRVAKSA
jgi:polar amino acid transport system substrate-binding protein